MTCFITDCFTTILDNGKLRKYCVRTREAGFRTIFNYFLHVDVVYMYVYAPYFCISLLLILNTIFEGLQIRILNIQSHT